MTESDGYQSGPESSDITNPGPNSAIRTYFSRIATPTPEEVVQAADIVGAAYREIEHTQDALNICADLARDVPQATTILAAMIGTDHETIPKRWRSDQDDIRMILSMVGYMEVGYLRAQQTAIRRGPEFPGLSERILAIEQLLDDLQ